MADKVRMGNLRHESNLVEFKPWKSIHKSITMPMIAAMGEKDFPESQLSLGFAYIDKPDRVYIQRMVEDALKNKRV